MKKNKKQDQSEKAENCRRWASDECHEFNNEAEREAIEEFDKGEIAKYFKENARYVTGLVIKRLEAVRQGELTFPLRAFDAETIARLLSACTEAPYDGEEFDENLSDEETVEAWECGTLVSDSYSTSAATTATGQQSDLREALLEYATAGAIYAKKIGSTSLLEWVEMIDLLDNRERWLFAKLSLEQAVHVIELEKSAANRLRLDMIVNALPPYKKPKPAKKAK